VQYVVYGAALRAVLVQHNLYEIIPTVADEEEAVTDSAKRKR
jgi:hypothetical protein